MVGISSTVKSMTPALKAQCGQAGHADLRYYRSVYFRAAILPESREN